MTPERAQAIDDLLNEDLKAEASFAMVMERQFQSRKITVAKFTLLRDIVIASMITWTASYFLDGEYVLGTATAGGTVSAIYLTNYFKRVSEEALNYTRTNYAALRRFYNSLGSAHEIELQSS